MTQKIDVSECGRIFQEKFGLVVNVAQQYAPRANLIHDIVQQTFVDFAELAIQGKVDSSRDLVPLLYEITRKRALKSWRQLRDTMPKNRRKLAEFLMERSRSRFATQKNFERYEDDFANMHRCLEKLPEKSREMIKEHYFEGVSIIDIAEKKNSKPDALRQLFMRLRIKLRECIRKHHVLNETDHPR